MTGISARGLYKVFGNNPDKAVAALKSGTSREELMEQGSTAAVIDASFDIEPGEIFVVMGLSGCGKSTLIRMVNGLLPATAGSLEIDGTSLTEMSESQLRSIRRDKISMVFQHFALLPHRTVAENAAYGLDIKGVSRKEREEKAREALKMVGSKAGIITYPVSCPAVCSSAWAWPVRLPRILTSCSWMRPFPPSTRSSVKKCRIS